MKRGIVVLVVALGQGTLACAKPVVQAPKMSAPVPSEDQAIRTTVTNVSHFIDTKQWQSLRGLYASTVLTDYTSLFGGTPQQQAGDDLIGGWRKLLTPVITQHLFGPITVEIEGSSATARCHVRGYHFVKDTPGGDEWMVAGHYSFGLTREPAGWRIQSMKIDTFYQSGNLKLLELAGGK